MVTNSLMETEMSPGKSRQTDLLTVLTVETNIGAFSVTAATPWNSLPVNVRLIGNIIQFCSHLKSSFSHVFLLGSLAYPTIC